MRKKMANTIRFLAADMVQKANSGHPGAPMGLADIVVVLSEYLKHNPKNPKWLNRDRLVFSGGHGSSLIYSLLHLWGYDLSLEDLKEFRQLDSKTPGHPEYGHTPGVEITTGPLGQGIANAVGFAMAEKYTANLVNSETCKFIDHKVYCLCGDGDLQEGISYEACSLAGHLSLDNLVLIYDNNEITIEGDTSIAWSENISMRFEAQGWDVKKINGHCYDDIDKALN
ncbi:MAG: transketolase, partial [Sulfurovaceae bacterium]|nr:transketolase [Sulfurovaceae bacterium]